MDSSCAMTDAAGQKVMCSAHACNFPMLVMGLKSLNQNRIRARSRLQYKRQLRAIKSKRATSARRATRRNKVHMITNTTYKSCCKKFPFTPFNSTSFLMKEHWKKNQVNLQMEMISHELQQQIHQYGSMIRVLSLHSFAAHHLWH